MFPSLKTQNFWVLSDGNKKEEIGVFSFWELSFTGIFVKLSKEWDPPMWLVPSSNVSLQSVLLCHFSFFIFFSFTQSFLFSLSEKVEPKLIELSLWSEVLSATGDSRNDVGLSPGQIVRHVNLEIGSYADDRGFKKWRRTEPRLDCETRGPWDWKLRWRQGIRETMSNWAQAGSWDTWTLRSWDRWVGAPFLGFSFFCSVFFFFLFGNVGFGCGFPMHSFRRSKEEDGLPRRSNEMRVATVGNTSDGVHDFGETL